MDRRHNSFGVKLRSLRHPGNSRYPKRYRNLCYRRRIAKRLRTRARLGSQQRADFRHGRSKFFNLGLRCGGLRPALKCRRNQIFFGSGNGTVGSVYSTDHWIPQRFLFVVHREFPTTLVTGGSPTPASSGTAMVASANFPGNTLYYGRDLWRCHSHADLRFTPSRHDADRAGDEVHFFNRNRSYDLPRR